MTLESLLAQQDNLITRLQALEHLSDGALQNRLQRHWRIVLPGVYLAATGTPTLRQRLRAALLYAGPDAQLSDATALTTFGVRHLPADSTIYVLIPATSRRVSRDGVRIRRTQRLPEPRYIDDLPYSPPARALADFAARLGDERTAFAVVADAVQRRIAAASAVVAELSHVTGRGAGVASRIAQRLGEGARSLPESEFLDLCRRSTVLPPPLVNALLELPGGRVVSPDALILDAALVHEVNGRAAHAASDQFDSMQERHDAMTTAGLTVLHSSPHQLRTEPQRIIAQVEACYLRDRGKGLPAGVKLVRT